MKNWFCGPASADTSSNVNAEATENWIPEFTAGGRAKARVVLKARPGLAADVTVGAGPHRCSYSAGWVSRAFFLSGTSFCERHLVTGVVTVHGIVAFSAEPGSIHGNGPGGGQLLIVSGGLGYIFTLATNGLAAIVDPDFPTDVIKGFYVKGSFGVIKRNSRIFALSTAFDGTSWSALDIAEKSTTIDSLIDAIVDTDSSELWLFGADGTSEVWWYDGAAAFPMSPVPNVTIPYGSPGSFSFVNLGGGLYGLAKSAEGGPNVIRFRGGYGAERISTHAIEQALQSYAAADVANARGLAIEWQGHRFYVLTIPDVATWVYDETTEWWHRWTYLNTDTGMIEAFLGVTHLYAGNTHFIGSRKDGALFTFTSSAADDAGREIRCLRRAPYLSSGPHRLTHNRLWFDVETGVGVVVGDDEDVTPIGMVRFSDDAAKTWSEEYQVSLGAAGEYGTLAELWRLGLAGAKGRVYEWVVSAAVVRTITDADVELGQEVA